MRLRTIISTWFLIAISMAGIANAATPAIDLSSDSAELMTYSSPVAVRDSFILMSALPPPPPPPPSCASTCRTRYLSCLNAGVNPGICGAKYNYCLMTCQDPPIFTQ
jgi:hypothetical protein